MMGRYRSFRSKLSTHGDNSSKPGPSSSPSSKFDTLSKIGSKFFSSRHSTKSDFNTQQSGSIGLGIDLGGESAGPLSSKGKVLMSKFRGWSKRRRPGSDSSFETKPPPVFEAPISEEVYRLPLPDVDPKVAYEAWLAIFQQVADNASYNARRNKLSTGPNSPFATGVQWLSQSLEKARSQLEASDYNSLVAALWKLSIYTQGDEAPANDHSTPSIHSIRSDASIGDGTESYGYLPFDATSLHTISSVRPHTSNSGRSSEVDSPSPPVDNVPMSKPQPSLDYYVPTGVLHRGLTGAHNHSKESLSGSVESGARSAKSRMSRGSRLSSHIRPFGHGTPPNVDRSSHGSFDGHPPHGYYAPVELPHIGDARSRYVSGLAVSIKQAVSRSPSPSPSVLSAGSAAAASHSSNGDRENGYFGGKAASEGRRDSAHDNKGPVFATPAIPSRIPVRRKPLPTYPPVEEGDSGPSNCSPPTSTMSPVSKSAALAASIFEPRPISRQRVKALDLGDPLRERRSFNGSQLQSPSILEDRPAAIVETLPHEEFHAPDDVSISTGSGSAARNSVLDVLSALSERIQAELPKYTQMQGSTMMSALRDLESVIGDQGNASVSTANASSMSPPPSQETGRQFASEGGYAGYEDDQGSDENEMQSQQPKGGKGRPIRPPAPGQGERMGRGRPMTRFDSKLSPRFDTEGAKIMSPFMARLKADRLAAEKAAVGPPDALASLSVPGAFPADDEERR